MNSIVFVLPFISAILGWCIHRAAIPIFFTRILPQKHASIAQGAGKLIATEMFSISELGEKLVNEESIKKIMPVIEQHIDEFLRNKLSKSMPIIGMFIGEKTINQLKEVFMKELELIFPATMKTYITNLEKDIDIKKLIEDKIRAIPPEKLNGMLKQSTSAELKQFSLFGALAGFVIGLIQLILTLIINTNG